MSFRFECSDAEVAYWLHKRGFSLRILIETEIRRNNLNFLKWAHEHEKIHDSYGFLGGIVGAADVNNVEMAQWYVDTYPNVAWINPTGREYSDRGLDMIKWLEEDFEWIADESNNDNSEEDNNDDDDSYDDFYDDHIRWIECIMRISATAGQLDIIQYLYDHPRHKPTCELAYNAAGNGHMTVVQWLHERQPACSESAIAYAIEGGHLEIAKWLHEQINRSTYEAIFHEQAKNRWAHFHRDAYSIDVAADKWTLEMVQWLHITRPNECTTGAMDSAAANGKIDIVQWLHAN